MFDHRDSSGWPVGRMVVAMFLLPALIACGGTKVLKNPEPMELVRPLTVATDDRITLLLDWVIVRGGPGTWAKNADWDEYLLRIQNNHAEPISVTSIAVYDSMETRQETQFMSPLNVHVTRYPISGEVKFSKYHPGKYLVAWHPKASEENERTTIVIENPTFGRILYRQIAGALAKRIVNYAKPEMQVIQGSDAGFIKFGSRVDLFLPLNTKIKVNLNDKVKGGEQIIATL